MGDADHAEPVMAAAGGVSCQHLRVAGILAGIVLRQDMNQRHDIAQGQIEALACHRVQGLGGIAQPDAAGRDGGAAVTQAERKDVARAGRGKAQARAAKVCLQCLQEGRLIECGKALRFLWRTGINHGVAVTCRCLVKGQQCQWPVGGEAFMGNVAMRRGRGDLTDQRMLVIVVVAHLCRQPRHGGIGGIRCICCLGGTFGIDDEWGRAVCVVRAMQTGLLLCCVDVIDVGMVVVLDAGGGQGIVECGGNVAGGRHLTKCRHVLFLCRHARAAETATLRDMDGGDGRGGRSDVRPESQPGQNLLAAM